MHWYNFALKSAEKFWGGGGNTPSVIHYKPSEFPLKKHV